VQLFGFEITRRRLPAVHPVPRAGGAAGILPGLVREPYTGAWQRNDTLTTPGVLSNPAVFTCETKIARDIAKLAVSLVVETSPDVWEATTNPAYSPVLRRPNHYQSPAQFHEQWILSKLTFGNAYILKRRDARGVVNALFVVPAETVTPLVAPDGSVYYELRRPDVDLTGLWAAQTDSDARIVGASELVHDRWNCLFHPLVGLSPLYAAALAAAQGTTMQTSSTAFFGNGNQPGGILIAPGALSDDQLTRLQSRWKDRKPGTIAVVSDGLKYETLAMTSVDAQFAELLEWTTETIAMVYGVPLVLLNAGKGAAYGANEPVIQLYHDECLQPLITAVEDGYAQALEFQAASKLGVEVDIDGLLWMSTDARVKAATETTRGGVLSPNEARRKYFGLTPVDGGDSPMMQQQQFSLAALAERDAAEPFVQPVAAAPADPALGGAADA
jgi:HK97 family phage portal protein